MSQPTKQRPPQVTLASGIIMFASIMVLLTAWERVTTLGSIETQEAIGNALAEAPFSTLGLDVQSATDLLRWVVLVAAMSACATAILGWYVRKPDRSARLGLTVFAVPVFVSGMSVGGLAGSFVAAGTAMLWLAPGREWFATGRWTPPAPRPEPATRTRPRVVRHLPPRRSSTGRPVSCRRPRPGRRTALAPRPPPRGSGRGRTSSTPGPPRWWPRSSSPS